LISQLELRQQLEVNTPKGKGRLFLSTEYGSEIEKIFTVILYNGEIWEFANDDIRVTNNITMGRKN
jgi:CYTH domain-containing protein